MDLDKQIELVEGMLQETKHLASFDETFEEKEASKESIYFWQSVLISLHTLKKYQS